MAEKQYRVFPDCDTCDGHGYAFQDDDEDDASECQACVLQGNCPMCQAPGFDPLKRCDNCTYIIGESGPFPPFVFQGDDQWNGIQLHAARRKEQLKAIKAMGRGRMLNTKLAR